MNWSFLENVLSGVNKYSTVIGRIWLSVVFLFRILVYVAAAEQVWKDEQKDFVCNTQQPGCENACFDHFFPISQVRLWALTAYHGVHPIPCWLPCMWPTGNTERPNTSENCTRTKGALMEVCSALTQSAWSSRYPLRWAPLLAFYFLYNGFEVPILLRCSQSPCPNTVDCYIARAKEKMIFLYIMGCTSILCITLNVVELMYIIWKQLWKCFTRRYIPVEESTLCHSQPPVSYCQQVCLC
uniref:Gap junction protein beta 7 n=1 Tax=Lates calcarifer TaxID=8187 RepID=A0A4W6BSX0_LATCA